MTGKEKYFEVLGITPTLDQSLIKKAYRKQALKFHPDRNNSPNAHYHFILITEAYEILSGQKTIKTGQKQNYKTKTKEEILAEKVLRAKERWRKQQFEEEAKDKAYYNKIASGWTWRIFQLLALYTASFSTLLTIDYYLDGETACVTTEAHEDKYSRILKVRDERFIIDNKDYWFSSSATPPIRANYSYLFHDLKSVSVVINYYPEYTGHSHSAIMSKYDRFENWELHKAVSFSSVYGVFPYLHLAFLIPLFVVFFKRPNLRFSVWRLVSVWIIYPTILYFTLSNGRIFNLFDLIVGA